MGPFFIYLALLAFAIALAKSKELGALTLSSDSTSFDNDLSSNANLGISDYNDNGEDSVLEGTVSEPATSSTTAQSLKSVGDDYNTIDLATANIGSGAVDSITNPSSSPATSYSIAELGDSLFNPGEWLVKGVQFLWSAEVSILNAEGRLISGAISIQGIPVYFVLRRVRKLNGEKEITEEAVQNVIEQIKCPDSGNQFPFQVVCKTRIRGLPKKMLTIGYTARTVSNVLPILKDNVFNAKILEFHYIICYCCKVIEFTDGGTGMDGKVCTVQMFA